MVAPLTPDPWPDISYCLVARDATGIYEGFGGWRYEKVCAHVEGVYLQQHAACHRY